MNHFLLTGGGNRRGVVPRYIEHAEGGRIAVVTAASEDLGTFPEYQSQLIYYGAQPGQISHISAKDDRVQEERGLLLESHTVVLTGGDQDKLVRELDPDLQEAIHHLASQGVLIAGTSAGTMAFSKKMIQRGREGKIPRGSTLPTIIAGLGLLPGVILDTHNDRSRVGRLLGALEQHPECLGIALDTGASVEIEGESLAAITGGITIMDPSEACFNDPCPGQSVGVTNVKMHALAAGGTYNLSSREARLRP